MASNLLEKGLDIFFEVVRAKSPLTVQDIAGVMNIPASTVYRIVGILKQNGWVEKNHRTGISLWENGF